jgi:hypothetical protein
MCVVFAFSEQLPEFTPESVLQNITYFRCRDHHELVALTYTLPQFLVEHSNVRFFCCSSNILCTFSTVKKLYAIHDFFVQRVICYEFIIVLNLLMFVVGSIYCCRQRSVSLQT